jgi:DNA-3-methyladenine glycosylase
LTKKVNRPIRRLRRAELPADTIELARYLIGKTLFHDSPAGRAGGRIVETEAYPFGDAAAHAFRGETPGNRSLFLERGFAYVYFAYGSSWMMNVTSEKPGVGGGVLVRALEPIEGIEMMMSRRGTTKIKDLARGPGRLASALAIDKAFDAVDLCAGGPLWLGAAAHKTAPVIAASVRIGITRDAERVLRFYERGCQFVSGPKRLRE